MLFTMEPVFPLLIILLIVGLAVAATIAIFRARHWRDMFASQRSIYESTMDRAMEAERELGHLTEEHGTLKTTFQQALALFQNRQSVAVMTDAQVNLISQTIAQLVAQQAGKNQLPN
jgi:hypothetical protein